VKNLPSSLSRPQRLRRHLKRYGNKKLNRNKNAHTLITNLCFRLLKSNQQIFPFPCIV
jgi:hypothetical protein